MAMNAAQKARIAGRKEAVKAGVAKGQTAKESRKRYYVETRVGEMKAKGKTVTPELRKQLREKFNSGDVSRKGFAAPKKKVTSSSSSSSNPPAISGTPTAPSSSMPSRNQIEGRGSYKVGSTKPSSMSADTKKGRSGGGKVYDFARNELLGVDDFGRAGKNLRKGNYGKAAKSAGAGVLELGSSIATIFGIGAGAKAAMAAGKAAKLAKGAKGVSNLKYYKNMAKGNQALNYGKASSTASKVGKTTKSQQAKAYNYYSNLGKPAAKTVAKTANKSVPALAKRTPRVAKTITKPMVKSTSKPLTSKAVVRKSVSKPLAKKVSKPVAKTTRPRNYSKSTGKPFTAKQEAAFKKEYSRVNKNASAVRQRRDAARKFPG
jgi:hypothetical protein